MDKLVPSMDHACADGLPSYPEPIEKMVLDLVELSPALLTHEELQLMNAWVRARMAPIREAKRKHPDSQDKVFRELGWPIRRSAGRG